MKFYVYKVPYIADSKKTKWPEECFCQNCPHAAGSGEPYGGDASPAFLNVKRTSLSVAKTGIDSQHQLEENGIDANTSWGFGAGNERLVREAEVGETEVVRLQSWV
jgi:hypothetical protein